MVWCHVKTGIYLGANAKLQASVQFAVLCRERAGAVSISRHRLVLAIAQSCASMADEYSDI